MYIKKPYVPKETDVNYYKIAPNQNAHTNGDIASNCPKCNGNRIWKQVKLGKDKWRQYCSKCHSANSYKSRQKRRLEYNRQMNIENKTNPDRIIYNLWKRCKDRANKLNLEFNLTREFIKEQLANGTCKATGIKFRYEMGDTKIISPFAPSVDKINPKLGYTIDNCQVVCWIYNRAKGDSSHEEVLILARSLCHQKH